MNNIQFVAGMHGNENLPVLALSSKNIPHIVANPKAISQKTRWVDADLNKSFGVNNDTYESMRAKEILEEIPENTHVFDFHTSDSADIPFAIVVDLKMVPLAEKTGLEKVVYMKYNIKGGHALINHRNGISIEAGTHKGKESFDRTIEIVENINSGKRNKVEVYETYGEISKPGNYRNFELYSDEDESFFPIFTGETSYQFIGLKTRKIEDFS